MQARSHSLALVHQTWVIAGSVAMNDVSATWLGDGDSLSSGASLTHPPGEPGRL